tara:strand:+ start:242 stop:1114 length:873 start_codon:yes stop_codon:yes gene_type:complete
MKSITFARVCPAELSTALASANHVVDLAIDAQMRRVDSSGQNVWDTTDISSSYCLTYADFVGTFYSSAIVGGGGDRNLKVSETNAKKLTMKSNRFQLTNGARDIFSVVTLLSDKTRAIATTGTAVQTGVNVQKLVKANIEADLGVTTDAWDGCSYIALTDALGSVLNLNDCLKTSSGSDALCCSMTLDGLVLELAKVADTATTGNNYVGSVENGDNTTAVSYWDGSTTAKTILVNISILFKNTTSGVKNTELKLHIKTCQGGNSKTLTQLIASYTNVSLNTAATYGSSFN